jgi:ATP phosphoribosyltransferase
VLRTIGIVGKDVLEEQKPNVVELKDLGTGWCRMILAAPAGGTAEVREAIEHAEVVRVATKYPRTARRYFEGIGRQAEIIALHGSIELAPLVGLAECIVDLTATGTTLRENNLTVLDEISSSPRADRQPRRIPPRNREVAALLEAMEKTRSPLVKILDAREAEPGVGRPTSARGGFLLPRRSAKQPGASSRTFEIGETRRSWSTPSVRRGEA